MTEQYDEPIGTTYPPEPPIVISSPEPVVYVPEPVSYTPEPVSSTSPDSTSTSQVAKEQAANVTQSATDAGRRVAGVAKDQASGVAAEATKQAKSIIGQTRSELQEQAATQQQRVAAGLRSLSDELDSMSHNADHAGPASELAQQAARRTNELAGWLEKHDPGSLVQEISGFARRRPGAFLAIAAGAGVLAGRLTRGAVAAAHDEAPTTENSASATGTSWEGQGPA